VLPALADAALGSPHPAARHAAGQVRLDRRRLLPAALVLAALAVVAALMLALANADPHAGTSAAATTTAATGPTASSTPTVASVILPVASASASASASRSPTPAASTTPALPNPAANPLGYLQAISNQIQAMIARGPSTLQPNAGQQLQNVVADLRNALASAQQNGGNKQWRDLRTRIANVEQQISHDAAAGQISQAAASTLSNELQQLANQLPSNGD
jgi:hypothetical protein